MSRPTPIPRTRVLTRRTLPLTVALALTLSTCVQDLGAAGMNLLKGDGRSLVQADAVALAELPTPVALSPPALPSEPPLGDADTRREPVPVTTPEPRRTAEVELLPVTALQPKIRLQGSADGQDHVADVLSVEGVAHATAVSLGAVTIQAPAGEHTLRVAAVDPVEFRVLTPQVTADAVEVWKRIAEGDAAFIHDVGYRLELELGGRVPAHQDAIRVGAYASNGVPPIADAIVSSERAEELGVETQQEILVAVAEGVDAEELAQRLEELTGLATEIIEDPVPRQAFLTGAAARQAFEPFTYIDNGDGMIQMDPAWVRRNIVSARVPVFTGHVLCHRLLVPQLRGALQEVVDLGLDHLIDPREYGGCWVPRHIDFNPRKPLSMHAWGLAVDFNVSTNQLGAEPQMDPRIVEVFDRWGFVWGGRWNRPDGMHFELGALMQSTGG